MLHRADGSTEEYSTASMQYAKRYADLYKSDYPFVEIIQIDNGEEKVFETFGKRI